jgi:hypothetical protein
MIRAVRGEGSHGECLVIDEAEGFDAYQAPLY